MQIKAAVGLEQISTWLCRQECVRQVSSLHGFPSKPTVAGFAQNANQSPFWTRPRLAISEAPDSIAVAAPTVLEKSSGHWQQHKWLWNDCRKQTVNSLVLLNIKRSPTAQHNCTFQPPGDLFQFKMNNLFGYNYVQAFIWETGCTVCTWTSALWRNGIKEISKVHWVCLMRENVTLCWHRHPQPVCRRMAFDSDSSTETCRAPKVLLRVSMAPPLAWRRSFAALSLLDVQDSVAAGTCVVGVLESLHEQRDQAAAKDEPAAQTHSRAAWKPVNENLCLQLDFHLCRERWVDGMMNEVLRICVDLFVHIELYWLTKCFYLNKIPWI